MTAWTRHVSMKILTQQYRGNIFWSSQWIHAEKENRKFQFSNKGSQYLKTRYIMIDYILSSLTKQKFASLFSCIYHIGWGLKGEAGLFPSLFSVVCFKLLSISLTTKRKWRIKIYIVTKTSLTPLLI